MSRRIHMLCNAHIDPVWQWEWEEGAAETLSTFRIAAEFCEEFQDFVFCHNEALLYRWVEEYDPALFQRIVSLVAQGKWHIMGGWHLQPDCNMPIGEALVRQIFSGRRYFKEKFNKVPRVALNADPFGHSRGLVQIMAKSGYEGYLFMRPWPEFLELPANDFRWVGYDGSSVIGIRMDGGYNSNKGQALQKIISFQEKCPDDDFILCMWGVGNHGGGPSRKDLEDITRYMAQLDKEIQLLHSTPEAYLNEVKASRQLQDAAISLNPWGPGCYTTMVAVKQKYRQTESAFFMTERMCAHAASQGLMAYPSKELDAAEYDLLTMQFHDILPGTSVQSAEEMAIRFLDHGAEALSRIRARAFFSLCSGQEKAADDAIPILVYNPFPYPLESDISCELNLWDQVRDPVFVSPTVFFKGSPVPTQCEKEDSTIPIEWRKRVTFHAVLEPASANRFDCKFETLPCRPALCMPENETHLIFQSGSEHIRISKTTGLIDLYEKDGRSILGPDAFRLDVYQDDFDPWAMNVRGWKDRIGSFTVLSDRQCAEFCHVDQPIPAVRVIENGPVRTVVEAVFGFGSSRAVVQYLFSKSGGMQLKLRVCWSEKQKLLKLRIPAAFAVLDCIGQQPYGCESLRPGEGEENCGQGYAIVQGEAMAFSLCNTGSYGVSFNSAESVLLPTLLRSPSYCAHPIDDRIVMPQDRFSPYIDQGERLFCFDFSAGTAEQIVASTPRRCQQLNEGVMAVSFYPSGSGQLPAVGPQLEGSSAVLLTAYKQAQCGSGYILRLFNSAGAPQSCRIRCQEATHEVCLSPYEILTLRYADGQLTVSDLMEGLLN